MPALVTFANLTEPAAKRLAPRGPYIEAHRPYLAYLHHVLDAATLPPCRIALANVTTIAALTGALRRFAPDAPGLNSIVLGRVLHRLVPGLLTWHGEVHALALSPGGVAIFGQTTAYRFPEVFRARRAFVEFLGGHASWSAEVDQWLAHDVEAGESSLPNSHAFK